MQPYHPSSAFFDSRALVERRVWPGASTLGDIIDVVTTLPEVFEAGGENTADVGFSPVEGEPRYFISWLIVLEQVPNGGAAEVNGAIVINSGASVDAAGAAIVNPVLSIPFDGTPAPVRMTADHAAENHLSGFTRVAGRYLRIDWRIDNPAPGGVPTQFFAGVYLRPI